GVGPSDVFVRLAYEMLLGRAADAGGAAHYEAALAAGHTRASVLRSFICSGEFAERYGRIAPDGGVVPRDTPLCELVNPAKWDNPEWLALLGSLGLSFERTGMHRKSYEFAQLAYGMKRLGLLHDRTRVLSVGAGHEAVLYWLANHVGLVVATDMYEGV